MPLGGTITAKNTIKQGYRHLKAAINTQSDLYQPRENMKGDLDNYLLLSYYRNHLIHLFINEAFIACSLMGFDYDDVKDHGVPRRDLWNKTKIISSYLNWEFVIEDRIKTSDDFDKLIKELIERQFLTENKQGDILVHENGMERVMFLCNLIWPLIDTYFITMLKVLKMIPHTFLSEKDLK